MLSTTIHHVAAIRRPLVNVAHFIYRCSSEVATQQVEPSIVNTSPTYGGAHESSAAAGLPQLQVILRNSSDNSSRHCRNLRRGAVRCCIALGTAVLSHERTVFLVTVCLSVCHGNCILGGYVPGVIYGKDYDNNVLKRLVMVCDKDLRRELRVRGTTFKNTLFELSVVRLDGLDSKTSSSFEAKPGDENHVIEKFVVVPRQTQLNPGND